jgi:type IV pilus assembly protein PilQ
MMKTYEQVSGLGRGLQMLVFAAVVFGVAAPGVNGQETPTAVPPAQGVSSSLVTINIDNGPLVQVLNAFSRQSGQNIVIGSEVTGNVTLRVTDKPWQDALDVILKPYGYDYYMVGDTIIICGKDKLPKGMTLAKASSGSTTGTTQSASSQKAVEQLVVKVVTLKFLDVSDVEAMIAKVSPDTKVGRLFVKSQSWEDKNQGAQLNQTTSSESLGRLSRIQEKSELVRSKTIVLVDTQDRIDWLMAEVIAKVDVSPRQIQIEAKFVEVRSDLLRDIGVEWGSGLNGATVPGVKTIGTSGAGSLYAAGGQQINGTVRPSGFDPQSVGLAGARPFNGGLTLAFQKLTDLQFEMLLHLMQEDVSYNMLSSPRVLTMDNQDAVIIVGQKLPIIRSEASGTAGATTISTTLDRYEDIGIKLKVLPQICDGNNINLVVHPSVRELLGYQSGKVGAAGDTSGSASSLALTEYPVVATREAETQVMIKSGQTIVIGGMLRDKKMTTQIKVPFLGSIPLLGALFRRDVTSTEKIELLIFLTATVRDTTEELAVKMPELKSMIKVEKGTAPAKP